MLSRFFYVLLVRLSARQLARVSYEALHDRLPDEETLAGLAGELRRTGRFGRMLRSMVAKNSVPQAQQVPQRGGDSELIHSVYRALLDREPDPAMLALHSRQLDEGLSREDFIAEIGQGTEHFHRLLQKRQ